jgi:hypothetical protein
MICLVSQPFWTWPVWMKASQELGEDGGGQGSLARQNPGDNRGDDYAAARGG